MIGDVGLRSMAIRIISFVGGALFGAGGAVVAFHFIEHSPVSWGIVGLAAGVMGMLAALFGRKFWETAIGLWPRGTTGPTIALDSTPGARSVTYRASLARRE